MTKIGIDARLYSQTGVGVYLRNLIHYLQQIATEDISFIVYLLPEDYRKVRFENKNFVKKLTHSSWHSFSEQFNFAAEIYGDQLDLMHFTYFSYPIIYKKKFIATIHDTTPLLYKTGKASTKNPFLYELKFRAFRLVISQQLKNAKYVITPTKTVKEQLVKIYGQKYEKKIKPIYEGVNFELTRTRDSKPEIKNSNFKNFFIYIGNFYPHKNVESLVKAFAEINAEAKLILIGPDDFFSSRLSKLIGQLKQQDRIVFYHNPTQADLVYYYRNAIALVHPSLSEGFGLPIIEAMNYYLPIIGSDIEVFRELLGDHYLKFNPKNQKDIKAKIETFLKNKTKFDYSKIVKKYSFEDMAKKTLKLYHESLI